MKLVSESYDEFQRGRDPKESMGIGLGPDIDTEVDTCQMTIRPRNGEAYIYFDEDGWDDHQSAIYQIEAFAEGSHDLIDFSEIEDVLAEEGYRVGDGEWEADGFVVSLPIERI